MRRRDVVELLALAALWGGSFLFMRVAVPAFGPLALAFLRVFGAALLLVPLLAARGELAALRRHWRPIAVVGLVNSALPFLCFAYAAVTINAGLSAIFNSATPLFAAIVAWLWLGDRLTSLRIAGLAIGFAGVLWLGGDKVAFGPGGSASAIAACLLATMSYGIAPSLTKRHLSGVPPLAVAAGSQVAAAIFLAVPAALAWPAVAPSPSAWLMMALLAVLGTGFAYVLYFRLIANAGPANAVAVTYLIPIFALVWGGVFLGEHVTATLLAGCLVIFVGTALATGVLRPRPLDRRATAPR
ncbi:MAG TPA: DMT family transporter [Caldimonas sp.]|nr:DMT family transporter [Caldimonas sp.]